MSTPALLRLREVKPDSYIALLTPEKLSDLWIEFPSLDEVITFSKSEGVGSVSKRLRSGNFQRALIFPNSFRSAFEPWLAGIPERIGYGGNGRTPFISQIVPRSNDVISMRKRSPTEIKRLITTEPDALRDTFPLSSHHIHQYLQLAAALGANPNPVAPQIQVTTREMEVFLSKFGLAGSKETLIGLNPGAEYGPAKRWPVERFIETVVKLGSLPRVEWLIFGGPGDVELGRQLESEIRAAAGSARIHNLAGRTTLRELCAGLRLCKAVLTNDTGPMHIAAAVGARVIVPFGSTSPELTGPGLPGDLHHQFLFGAAPCAPCFLRVCPIDFRCMHSITADQAAAAVSASLRSPH
jgi:heptosyltransferase II